jgi:hypothetical protein
MAKVEANRSRAAALETACALLLQHAPNDPELRRIAERIVVLRTPAEQLAPRPELWFPDPWPFRRRPSIEEELHHWADLNYGQIVLAITEGVPMDAFMLDPYTLRAVALIAQGEQTAGAHRPEVRRAFHKLQEIARLTAALAAVPRVERRRPWLGLRNALGHIAALPVLFAAGAGAGLLVAEIAGFEPVNAGGFGGFLGLLGWQFARSFRPAQK